MTWEPALFKMSPRRKSLEAGSSQDMFGRVEVLYLLESCQTRLTKPEQSTPREQLSTPAVSISPDW